MPDVTGTNYLLATDACSSALSITQTPTNNAVLALGPNEVVLAVADSVGNTAYSTNWVIVQDSTPPVLTLLGANPLTNECHAAFVDPGAAAADNCSGVVSLGTNSTVNPNAVGVYAIDYLATDAAGNSTTNTRIVYVVDTTQPTIANCVPDQSLTAGVNLTAPLPDLTAQLQASDNCSASLTIVQTPLSGTDLPLGVTSVVFAVDDGNGNTNTCSAAVTVNSVVLVPPSITGLQMSSDSCFQLTFTGPSGQSYTVLASEDAALPLGSWNVLTNGTFGAGAETCTDNTVPGHPSRFYRIVSP
jgi:hypothetical protein